MEVLEIGFIRKSGEIFATNIFATILAMATGIIVARRLGPEQRGYFGLVVLASNLIASLGHMGFGTAITYYAGKKTFRNSDILAFMTLASAVVGGTMVALFYLLYPLIPEIWTEIPKHIMLIGLVASPFALFHNYFIRFLLALLRIRESNITNILRNASNLALVAALLFRTGAGLYEAVIAFTASTIIASVMGFFLYTTDIRQGWKIDREMVMPFMKFGGRAYFLLVFNFVNLRLVLFLIKYFLGASEVSYYSIAVNMADRLWYIPHAIGALLFPTLMTMEKGTSAFTAKVCRNNFFIMLVLGLFIVISAKYLIVIMYGREYYPVTYALYSIMTGIVMYPFYLFLQVEYASKNRLGLSVFTSFIGILVNLGANLLLIPRWGIIGAGIATSLSYTVLTVILAAAFIRETGVTVRELFIPYPDELRAYFDIGVRYLRKLSKRDIGAPTQGS